MPSIVNPGLRIIESVEDIDDCIQENATGEAASNMKLEKSVGRDNISPEFIKFVEEEMERKLQMLFQKIWDEKKIP